MSVHLENSATVEHPLGQISLVTKNHEYQGIDFCHHVLSALDVLRIVILPGVVSHHVIATECRMSNPSQTLIRS